MTINPGRGFVFVNRRKEYDPTTGRWKKDYYNSGEKFDIPKKTLTAVQALWDTKQTENKKKLQPDEPPAAPAAPKKRKKGS